MNVLSAGLAVVVLCGYMGLGLSNVCTQEVQIYICQGLPQSFPSGLSSLVVFVNNVGEIDSTVFNSDNLASVTRLTINNAGITGISPGALNSFKNLQTLSLDLNSLSQFNPAWFSQPAILQNVSLIGNRIDVLKESMLHGLTGLTSLNLSRNMIHTIAPGSFSSQASLERLDLSGNNLTQIEVLGESMFKGLTGLTSLNLSRNMIHAIAPGSFSSQAHLECLDLSGNRLTRVRPQAFPQLSSTRIKLDGNPWDCSCGAEDFVAFLKGLQNASLLEREEKVTCETPAVLKGQPVWNVSECVNSTVSPSTYYTHKQPTAASITVPTLIGVIVVLCVLVCGVCALAMMYRRKRERKQVNPGPEREKGSGGEQESSEKLNGKSTDTLQRDVDPRETSLDPELARINRRYGIRAKSANAVLSTSQFCSVVKELHRVEMQQEGPSEDRTTSEEENIKELEESQGFENDDLTSRGSRGLQRDATGTENLLNSSKSHIQTSEDTETIPYLSIGADLTKTYHDTNDGYHGDSPGQTLQRAMGRVSTWPPTSAHWQAHCAVQREGLSLFVELRPEPKPELECDSEPELEPEPEPGSEVKGDTENLSVEVSMEGDTHDSVPETSPTDVSLPEGDRVDNAEEEEGNTEEKGDRVDNAEEEGDTEKEGEGYIEEALGPGLETAFTTEYDQVLPESTEPSTGPSELHSCLVSFETASSECDAVPLDGSEPEHLVESGEAQSSLFSMSQTQTHPDHAEELENKPGDPTQTTDMPASQGKGKTNRKALSKRGQTQREGHSNSRESRERNGAGSQAPPSGGSPGDENLLLNNEYTYIDLLHEVVQNQGRWTRERWRQTHINKQRNKHQRQGHWTNDK